jgi:hypothetical protein
MKLEEFIFWKGQDKPQDVMNDYLVEFAQLGKNVAFKKYLQIIEWRIHNLTEQILLDPKEANNISQRIEGMRMILLDFKRIQKKYHESAVEGSQEE